MLNYSLINYLLRNDEIQCDVNLKILKNVIIILSIVVNKFEGIK